MKKLVVIALALFTLNGMAQERKKRKQSRENMSELIKDMTPTEIADLKTKRMTLDLDLSDEQKTQVHKIILKQSEANLKLRKERKVKKEGTKEKPSKDKFVKMQNHRLDQQIALKQEMKKILTTEQYVKFEKMKPRKHKRKRKHSKKE